MVRKNGNKETTDRKVETHGRRRAKGKRTMELPEEQEPVPSKATKGNDRKKKGKVSVSEARLARYLPKPNTSVRERIARAFTHRLYLIDKKLPASETPPSSCDFFVLGATGNVYTVKLDLVPSCTCPDHAKGNTCKHILFVMLRVLKLPADDPRVWQKALLSSELHDLLHNLSVNDAVLASSRVRQHFKLITGESSTNSIEESSKESNKPVQREIDGDCPICYEAMAGSNGKLLEPVVFCKTCGNNVHADCFNKWSKSKARGSVTCIYCRAVWVNDAEGKTLPTHHGDYINLASYSDAHKAEETSLEALYPDSYQWWRR